MSVLLSTTTTLHLKVKSRELEFVIEEIIDTPKENLYTLHKFNGWFDDAQRSMESEPVTLNRKEEEMGSLKGAEPKKAKKKAAPKKAAKKKAAKKK
jgi:hypothetical protein